MAFRSTARGQQTACGRVILAVTKPKCPDCGHCDCIQTRPTQTCEGCFISLSESERVRGFLVHEDGP